MADTVTELRAVAERLADTCPPEIERIAHKSVAEGTAADFRAYAEWWDTTERTVLVAAGESVDLLRDALTASGWPRPSGTRGLPMTDAERLLHGAQRLAERWARPVGDLAVELAKQCAWGIPARPGRGYRHHVELVRLARESIATECERALAEHPEYAVPEDHAISLLDDFEREATRLTLQVVR